MHTIFLVDWALFLGRFHPILVHLPIGFLLLAIIMEWWPGKSPSRSSISLAWTLGAGSAAAAAFCGWLLASDGEYGGDALFWHRWLGVSVTVMSLLGVWLARSNRKVNRWYGLAVAGLLMLAGHQGGNLTHGEAYLWAHAPSFVQGLVGHDGEGEEQVDFSEMAMDSIPVYATFIQPLLEKKCVQCHNADKQNGGLRMDEPAHLFLGGESGELIADDPTESLWIKRVTLPRDNEKAMPPQGAPVSYVDVELLSWWMESGADTLAVLDPEEMPEKLKALLLRDYQLDLSPKTFVETLKVNPLTQEEWDQLAGTAWQLNLLAADNGALDVKVKPGQTVGPQELDQLLSIAGNQVVWLSLEKQQLSGEYAKLKGFTNLNRLKLNNGDVSDPDLGIFAEMPYLESLNLYGTQITDEGVRQLMGATSLRRLYLWQTETSEEAVAALQEKRPDMTINTGFRFAESEDQKSK